MPNNHRENKEKALPSANQEHGVIKPITEEYGHSILAHNNLGDFERLWALELAWFEPPNHRRGGWSGVSRHSLALPEGGSLVVFIKRQENHTTSHWRHPLRGITTALREYKNLRQCREAGIQVPELLYFAERWDQKKARAILITAELTDFVPLSDWMESAQWHGQSGAALRAQSITAVAKIVALLHQHRLQHSCLYPKHIFIRRGPSQNIEVSLIDLEKARRRSLSVLAGVHDVDTLNRHCKTLKRTDRMRFFSQYGALLAWFGWPQFQHSLARWIDRKTRKKLAKAACRDKQA